MADRETDTRLARSFSEARDLSVADLWPNITTREPGPEPPTGRGRRVVALVLVLGLAASATGFAWWAFGKETAPRPQPVRPDLATCGLSFRETALPVRGHLASVNELAPIARDDVWAFGMSGPPHHVGQPVAVFARWDGRSWTEVPAAFITGYANGFNGKRIEVTGRIGSFGSAFATASDDIWISGWAGRGVLEHWDGSRWSEAKRPGVRTSVAVVDATSEEDVSATVAHGDQPGDDIAIEHWDGLSWSTVSPLITWKSLSAQDEASSGRDDVWLILTNGLTSRLGHWDGNRWKLVGFPLPPGAQDVYLWNMDARSRNDAWLAGQWFERPGHNGHSHMLIEHWDGRRWSLVPAPQRAAWDQASAYHVAAADADDAWVTGEAVRHESDGQRVEIPLLLHWNGTRWDLVRGPNPADLSLGTIATLPTGETWIAGERVSRPGGTRRSQVVFERVCANVARSR
jgi:hypothetical protein